MPINQIIGHLNVSQARALSGYSHTNPELKELIQLQSFRKRWNPFKTKLSGSDDF